MPRHLLISNTTQLTNSHPQVTTNYTTISTAPNTNSTTQSSNNQSIKPAISSTQPTKINSDSSISSSTTSQIPNTTLTNSIQKPLNITSPILNSLNNTSTSNPITQTQPSIIDEKGIASAQTTNHTQITIITAPVSNNSGITVSKNPVINEPNSIELVKTSLSTISNSSVEIKTPTSSLLISPVKNTSTTSTPIPSNLDPTNNTVAKPVTNNANTNSANSMGLQLRTQPSQQTNQSSSILGIDPELLIKIGVIGVVVAIIVFIIYKLYQRKRTRQDYNENPQIFGHLPNLKFGQEYHLKHTNMEVCLGTSEQTVIKPTTTHSGQNVKVTFKSSVDDNNSASAVYFHRRQNTTCYFEIQILSLNGQLQIGYCPVDKFSRITSKQTCQIIGAPGVSIDTNGQVMCQGFRQYKYNLSPNYGDVIGIGINAEEKKMITERRGWVSVNGKLLNPPTSEEINKWISQISISADEKNNFDLKEDEDNEEEVTKGDKKAQDEKKKKKQEKQRKEADLLNQKVSLKTYNKFEYYPVIRYSNGAKDKTTQIVVNVGGQIFRMNDKKFRSGLLKDKPLFFSDNQEYD